MCVYATDDADLNMKRKRLSGAGNVRGTANAKAPTHLHDCANDEYGRLRIRPNVDHETDIYARTSAEWSDSSHCSGWLGRGKARMVYAHVMNPASEHAYLAWIADGA